MIKELVLDNFKLFKKATRIPLSNLNLLTGANGRGKSTVLQAFLLFMQSIEHSRSAGYLQFNTPSIRLGFFEDVKNVENSPKEPIKISFCYKFGGLSYEIEYNIVQDPEDLLVGRIKGITVSGKRNNKPFCYEISEYMNRFECRNILGKRQPVQFDFLYDLFIPRQFQDATLSDIYKSLPLLKVHYVAADRIGPKLYYSSKSPKEFNSTGAFGAETISTFFHNRNVQVDDKFIENIGGFFHVVITELETTVEGQVNFWFDQIFRSAKCKITPIVDTDLLKFEISPDGSFNFHKPTNVGYGFSYVLPIIVSGLIAKSGEILIVENPEAHLHPYAQSILAKFLTLVSLKGVQVIVESHSEHILNGLRIPIFDGNITNDTLTVLYFERSSELPFVKIDIDEQGAIGDWPTDFFDQSTNDFNYLLGI